MRRIIGFLLLSVLTLAGLVLTATPSRGEASDPNVVRWDTIIGSTAIVPTTPGPVLGVSNFQSPIPWVAQGGHAWVHLQKGQVKFSVKGLVLANSTGIAVAGTTGIISEVKGTLVCNGIFSSQASAYVDTAAVPLDSKGNAEFVGTIEVPTACFVTPQKMVFLIRVAAVSDPNVPPVGTWIAVGGIRTP